MNPYQIEAKQETYIKVYPEQSSRLFSNEIYSVKKGDTFHVKDYSLAETGHVRVEFDKESTPFCDNLSRFIFTKHWKMSWEDDNENDNREIYLNLKSEKELKKGNVDWNDPTDSISKYFFVYEVTQKDPRRIPQTEEIKQNILLLARHLDRVREQWGSPVVVTSWYRPPLVNREVGGVSNSQHLYGLAADIRPLNGDIWHFQDWLDTVGWSDRALGLGASKGFCHVDMRDSPIRFRY